MKMRLKRCLGLFGIVSAGFIALGCSGPADSVLAASQGQVSAPAPEALARSVKAAAIPLKGTDADYDALIRMVGDARVVMLGEASHGTSEFYRERARITRRLIREKGFRAVVIEGDWPDAERVNRYVRGESADATPEQALSSFTRFPEWMWRNAETRDLVRSLREHNDALPADAPRVGFYGMDVYSVGESARAVEQALARVDPREAQEARRRYQALAAYRADAQEYGAAVAAGRVESAAADVAEQFRSVERMLAGGGARTVAADPREEARRRDALFSALQNARVVRNGEEYFRVLHAGGRSTWNLRDTHMADTLDALAAHLGSAREPGKVIVWAHNTHVGDARATEMGEGGELNVGQLMRQRHPGAVVNVGFTTYTGSVLAAEAWGTAGKVRTVLPSLPGSYGALFHQAGVGSFLLPLRGAEPLAKELAAPRLQRAIGVIYLPRTERASHYFNARLSRQFDAVVHIDQSRAVTPLAAAPDPPGAAQR
jgi:erythromycin esterase-like protein